MGHRSRSASAYRQGRPSRRIPRRPSGRRCLRWCRWREAIFAGMKDNVDIDLRPATSGGHVDSRVRVGGGHASDRTADTCKRPEATEAALLALATRVAPHPAVRVLPRLQAARVTVARLRWPRADSLGATAWAFGASDRGKEAKATEAARLALAASIAAHPPMWIVPRLEAARVAVARLRWPRADSLSNVSMARHGGGAGRGVLHQEKGEPRSDRMAHGGRSQVKAGKIREGVRNGQGRGE